MNKLDISRAFGFEMAHHLPGHKGLCKQIHGHSYRLKVTVRGPVLKADEKSNDGMIIDFSELKLLVEQSVLSELDHALVLRNSPASVDVKASLAEIGVDKVLLLDEQPTCENVLLYIREKIVKELPSGLSLARLRLQETPETAAEWRSEDNA